MEDQPAGAAPWGIAAPLPPAADPDDRHRRHRPGRRGDRPAVGGESSLKPPAGDIDEFDPGLARERTELAWTRTAIGFAAVGAAILKFHPAIGLPVLLLSPVVWRLGRLPGAAEAGGTHDRRLLLITVAITGISLVALVLSFLGQGNTTVH
jgi:uncharacterized membrane protein YidH (DUF202 family)